MVISTLLNSWVVLPTNSPKAVNFCACASCLAQQFDLLVGGKCILRLRQRHQRLQKLDEFCATVRVGPVCPRQFFTTALPQRRVLTSVGARSYRL